MGVKWISKNKSELTGQKTSRANRKFLWQEGKHSWLEYKGVIVSETLLNVTNKCKP
jgi:hypothetical protein